MFNYKKSLLSIAAATALTVTSASAGYIPLSDINGTDEQWTLFGVTGLQISGPGAGTSAGTFSITDSTANTIKDKIKDDLFVEGMKASTGENLAKVKTYQSYIEVRVDTKGAVFNETEPVRTMYVTFTDGAGPDFAFTYRASLEGHTMQYSKKTDGSDAHTVTISSANTYSNPALGATIQEVPSTPGSALSKITDLVDYNLSNNPQDSAYYDKDIHQNVATTGDYLRIYSYDAATQVWGLYDSRNNPAVNNFSELVKGKAYWAKMKNGATEGGLVLGSSSISPAEYITAGITDGWNLMSFEKQNPEIRNSSTGLILSVDANATISIYDVSGNHNVDIDITTDLVPTSNKINQAIKVATLQGKFPDTFSLRAYPISTTDKTIALVSNTKFIVADKGGAIGKVTTLAGKDPYKVKVTDLVNTDDSTAMANLGDGTDISTAPAAMSKYGEYSLVIQPLLGSNTASADASAAVQIQSAASDAEDNTADAITNETTMAGVATVLTNGGDIGGSKYKATYHEIDTDVNGTSDAVLISATTPFYVRDHTFARVFTYKDVNNSKGKIIFSKTGNPLSTTITDGTLEGNQGDDNATGFVTNVNNNAPAGLKAVQIGTTADVVFITSKANANEFEVLENTSPTVKYDTLTDATTTKDIGKGAVKGVYSLDGLASAPLKNTIYTNADLNTSVVKDSTGMQVSVTTTFGTFKDTNSTDTATSLSGYATLVENQIKTLLSNKKIAYTSVSVDSATLVATIESSEVTNVKLIQTGAATSTADTNATSSTFGVANNSADLASDLKYNAIYSPNYVVNGPLYTMKKTGFTLDALVTGTTDLQDSKGSVNWDSIDLTRKPSEWLKSQDYNLFRVNESSGYWAYLTADTGANNLALSNAVLSPLSYTHRFNENGTNYNSLSGNIELTVDGLNEYDDRQSAVVKVSIAGSEVELAHTAGSIVYSGKLSSFEIEDMVAGENYDVLADISDGLGYNKISLATGLVVDLLKPKKPVVVLGDGTAVSITSASTDVKDFFIFKGQIPEISTTSASNFLSKVATADAAAYGLCQSVSSLKWYNKEYALNIIAVDGKGDIDFGNVSDTAVVNFVPTLKDKIRLTDENAANDPTQGTTLGEVFDKSCASTGPQTVNYGMTLTSLADNKTVNMAYQAENVTDTTANPISLFVNSSAPGKTKSIQAKITYADVYAGKSVYVELEQTVYSLVLPTQAEINGDDNATNDIGTDDRYYGAANVGANTDTPLDLYDGIDDKKDDTNTTVTHGYAELQAGQHLVPVAP